MNKLLRILIIFVLTLSVPMTSALAHNDHGKDSLVALGDSVPFGYSVHYNNAHPAKYAFPYLMGDKADLRVRNLAVPGWSTDELLAALQSNKKFRQAVKRADYVAIHIGGNDFLEILKAASDESRGDAKLFHQLLEKRLASSDVFANLREIIAEIRSQTHGKIVLYNIYNPFQENDPLHQVAELYLPHINAAYESLAHSYKNVKLADAYSIFGDKQAKYVIQGDIHPTKAGHAKLAKIGLRALSRDYAHHHH